MTQYALVALALVPRKGKHRLAQQVATRPVKPRQVALRGGVSAQRVERLVHSLRPVGRVRKLFVRGQEHCPVLAQRIQLIRQRHL